MSAHRGSLKVWLPAVLAAGALLSTCQAPATGVEVVSASGFVGDPEALLPGTWLREVETDGIATRRILTLESNHLFHEAVRVTDASGRSVEYAHEGTWLYDGVNLKRKYTLMNGRPPSRLNLPFATFQITFDSPREFRGVDHIRGHTIEYHLVAPGTQL